MELTTRYYTAYGLTIASAIPLPPLHPIAPAPVDLTIRRGHLPESPVPEETKLYRAGLNARFARTDAAMLWLNWSPRLSFMAVNGNELVVDTTETDDDLIALFTLSEALGLILYQKGYFLLHGSAIQINHKGVVFLGEPGAGKSTTVAAFAQKGVGVLSDDMVCIRTDEAGTSVLIPAFPQLKIWQNSVDGLQLSTNGLTPVREGVNKFSWHESLTFDDAAVPLAQVFVLTPPDASAGSCSKLPASQVPVELLRYFPLPDALLSGDGLNEYFEKSVAIARTTPLFRMSRPADFAKLYGFVDDLKTTL